MVNVDLIERAFYGDSKLKKRVFDAISETPQYGQLFEDITLHLGNARNLPASDITATESEPTSKKRKLENGLKSDEPPVQNHLSSVIFEAKNLSFSIPQRKKLHLEILQGLDPHRKAPVDSFSIRTRIPASGEVAYESHLSAYKHVLLLPVPEKAQKQYNFCLLPEENLTTEGSARESHVFTVSDSERDGIATALESAMHHKVIRPEENEFASAVPEPHRKGDKSFHVKAFKGSKDGYLFFLATGIFFGFKKPLQFFAFDEIESTSYTSVLQRTFNLNIAYKIFGSDELREQEFCMVDQVDFASIDEYIKKHELQDASMAEARKAKKLNVNGGKKGGEAQEQDNEDEASELQKAQQEMEDAEGEEEEDYDPGSDGESDGSAASSEGDEDDGEGAEDDGNLVEEELGSEAEDIEVDAEDGDQL